MNFVDDNAAFQWLCGDEHPTPLIGQNGAEIFWALDLARSFLPDVRVILEIGSGRGGNLVMLSRLFKEPGLLISLSTVTEEATPYWPLLPVDLVRDVIHPVELIHIDQSSTSLLALALLEKTLRDRKIDLVFIDASHTYYDTKYNFVAYLRFLNRPSMVMFHDIALTEGSEECWAEVEATSLYPCESMVADPATHTNGIGVVHIT